MRDGYRKEFMIRGSAVTKAGLYAVSGQYNDHFTSLSCGEAGPKGEHRHGIGVRSPTPLREGHFWGWL